MIIQAPRFQYLIPFGTNIFEIELRDYRCPILKSSRFRSNLTKITFFFIHYNCPSIFPLNSFLPNPGRAQHVVPFLGWVHISYILFYFLTKGKKAFTYPFNVLIWVFTLKGRKHHAKKKSLSDRPDCHFRHRHRHRPHRLAGHPGG